MIGHTANEQKLYGEKWSTVHGGYFSDRAIAAPLVEAVLDAVADARPSAIADLGGGTGFLLGEVLRRLDFGIEPSMVCVDTSRQQLDDCPETMLTRECSMEEVERGDLVEPGGSLLLCTRSVLHYLGEKMLKPELCHVRSMLEPGERFVHQTICFESEKEQAVANALYDRMDTGKWYPTAHFLMQALREERFELADIRPAAPIPLTSAELERRYGMEHGEMMEIGGRLEEMCAGHLSSLYHRSRNGFTVYLDYAVLTCVAR